MTYLIPIIIQVQNGNRVLNNRVVPCLKCMELAYWVKPGQFGLCFLKKFGFSRENITIQLVGFTQRNEEIFWIQTFTYVFICTQGVLAFKFPISILTQDQVQHRCQKIRKILNILYQSQILSPSSWIWENLKNGKKCKQIYVYTFC